MPAFKKSGFSVKRFPFGSIPTAVQRFSCNNRQVLPRLLPLFIFFPPRLGQDNIFCHEKMMVPETGLGFRSSMTTEAVAKRHRAIAAKKDQW